MQVAHEPMRTVPRSHQAQVAVEVSCTACGAAGHHRVPTVAIAAPGAVDGWDGFFTPAVLTCRSCGVEDQYEVSGLCRAALTLRAIAATPGDGASPVLYGVAGLWDGTFARRASQALRHLRALAEATPERGEGWRRLGNFCERGGRMQEAADHWMHAMTVDPAEFEAVYSLALACEAPASRSFAEEGLVRFSRIDGPTEGECAMAEELARRVCAWGAGRSILASWAGGSVRGQPIVDMSSARLDSIAQPERIVDFLLEEEVLLVAFGDSTIDDDDVTRLEARLGAPHDLLRFAAAFPAERPHSPPAARKADKKQQKAQKKARKANRKGR